MGAKAVRCALVLLFWTAAAALVFRLGPLPLKLAAIFAVAFAYMRCTRCDTSLDHAIFVGVAWLLFNIVAELVIGGVVGHGWYGLIGSPAQQGWRDLLMLTWLMAPAFFARAGAKACASPRPRRVSAFPSTFFRDLPDFFRCRFREWTRG